MQTQILFQTRKKNLHKIADEERLKKTMEEEDKTVYLLCASKEALSKCPRVRTEMLPQPQTIIVCSHTHTHTLIRHGED